MSEDSSSVREADLVEVFARLRDEVRRSQVRAPLPTGPGTPGDALRARDVAERLWALSTRRRVVRRPGRRAAALFPLKKMSSRAVRWYLAPALADQREFNAAVLSMIDELHVRVLRLERDQGQSPEE
jgi:hypothetical protein